MASCGVEGHLTEGDYLVEKVTIVNDIKSIDRDDTKALVRQWPNTKVLGLYPLSLTIYYWAQKKEENKFRKWVLEKFGEEPILYNTIFTQKSKRNIELFLQNKGYFNSMVYDSVYYKKNKAYITYFISNSIPYKLRKISYLITDNEIAQIIYEDTAKSVLVPGSNYNLKNLLQERENIAHKLKNNGYYAFNKEYIFFEVDTTIGNHYVDLKVKVKDPLRKINETDSVSRLQHKQYLINSVYIIPDYSIGDTSKRLDTLLFENYSFVYNKLKYKPNSLIRSIFLKPHNLYQAKQVSLTYNRLSNLSLFKIINIQFEETVLKQHADVGLLDCYISLTPLPRYSFSVELEGTHNASIGNGVAGNFVFRNKNTFKSTDLLEIKLKGALQVQANVTEGTGTEEELFSVFNTLEFGPELTWYFPDFLLIGKINRFSEALNPKTALSASYTFQQRTDFTRKMFNLSLKYSWKNSAKTSHSLAIPEINYINVDESSTIFETQDIVNNILLKSQFTDQFITGIRYSYTFNNQPENNILGNFSFLKFSIETSGNIFYLSKKYLLNDTVNTTGQYEIIGLPFAHYIIPEVDYRHYRVFNENFSLVGRINLGMGMPLGNSDVLPFVKSFNAAGSNDIRAWNAYELGPGSYYSDSIRTQVGDIKIEANLEYRFSIYKYIKGAVFLDAGNVWLLKQDSLRQGAEFYNAMEDFWQEGFVNDFAIGGGTGIRFDFSFFLIRFDLALPIRNPAISSGEKWIWNEYINLPPPEYPTDYRKEWFGDNMVSKSPLERVFVNQLKLNIGIGYPF